MRHCYLTCPNYKGILTVHNVDIKGKTQKQSVLIKLTLAINLLVSSQ